MFLFSCAYAYAYVACVMLIAQVGTRLKAWKRRAQVLMLMLMSLVLCLSHKWEPGLRLGSEEHTILLFTIVPVGILY